MNEQEFKHNFVLLHMMKDWINNPSREITSVVDDAMDVSDAVIEGILQRDPNFFSDKPSIPEPQLKEDYVREMSLNQFANMLPSGYAVRFYSTVTSFNNGAYHFWYGGMKLETVNDLIHLGKNGFLKLRNVGRKMLTEVDNILERYGITDW